MKTQTKHTPQWTYKENGKGYTIESNKRYIAYTATYGTTTNKENWDEANARLIAAAPILLEALKSLHDLCLVNYGQDANRKTAALHITLVYARDAIKKAEGRE